MKYLKIQNNGVLDIRLVALMGGTTKANDKYKIGQFGSGLKYTLAFLFRNNIEFKIFAGTEEVKLHTETEVIRDEDFEIICINGQRTSITTKMGEAWEPWMIIREIWCNALDEGGAVKEITTETSGTEETTTFFLQIDSQIQRVLDEWNKYFIHSQNAIFENDECALYPAGDHLCIYKQGVLVHENKQHKSVFSYDYKSADINELREFRGSISMVITHCLCDTSEHAASHFLENVTENHFEGSASMDYNWYRSFGKAWKEVIGNAKLIDKKSLDVIRDRGNTPDMSTLIVVPEVIYKALSKEFKGIGALYVADALGDFYEVYDEAVEKKVKQGLTILEACEYPMHPELTFVYGWFGDNRVLAKVVMPEKKVYVSIQMLQSPLIQIVAMLIEENEHFNTGMSDHTREFQQHFINLYTRELLSKNEIEI